MTDSSEFEIEGKDPRKTLQSDNFRQTLFMQYLF